MTDKEILKPLVERVVEICADPKYERLKLMWTRHNHLEKVEKVPVNVHLPQSPGYGLAWPELVPPETLLCKDPLARGIELQLKEKIYKYEHIPDDDVILPVLYVVGALNPGSGPLWGLEIGKKESDLVEPGHGAYKIIAPLAEDLSRFDELSYPKVSVDMEATALRLEKARELIGDTLAVVPLVGRVHTSPFEVVVQLRGMNQLLYDFYDNPALVHKLMDFVTEGTILYYQELDRRHLIYTPRTWMWRVHYEEVDSDVDLISTLDGLKTAWAYISAQSAASISPGMFDEFIQPYHERIAQLFSPGRVYYHGCEDLTKKFDVIRKLPHLRRFHVSPWSDLEVLASKIGYDYVIEKHVHPTNNIFFKSCFKNRSFKK